MYKISSVILALLLIIAVAACGGDDEATTENSQAPAAEVDQSASSSNNGGPTFSVTVTGAEEESYTQAAGRISYSVLDLGDTLGAPVKNELLLYEGGLDPEVGLRQVTLAIPQETEAGTYDLQGSMVMFTEGAFAASFSTSIGRESNDYDQNIDGTLTLDSVDGDTISGSFEFSADSVDFDDAGQAITQTVEISGEFSNVPLVGG